MSTLKNILVIDDDKDLVNTIRIVLESKAYEVRVAYDGQQGYQKIVEKKPDLIILDVMMATDTEGFDLAYKIKRQKKWGQIPILMLTAFITKMPEKGPDTFAHIMAEEWPVSQLLEKPVDPEKLLSIVKMLLTEAEQE